MRRTVAALLEREQSWQQRRSAERDARRDELESIRVRQAQERYERAAAVAEAREAREALAAAVVAGPAPDWKAPRICGKCHGLSHRRPMRGHCPGCFERYAAETIARPESKCFSPVATFASW